MGPYDHRSVTLDPGLTALALRARHEGESRYPFVERYARRRRRARLAPARPAASPAHSTASVRPGPAPFWPRSLRADQLFPTLSRLRGLRGASSAAA